MMLHRIFQPQPASKLTSALLLLTIVSFFGASSFAAGSSGMSGPETDLQAQNTPGTKGPHIVKVGLYVNNLYDIDFAKNQYDVEFRTWFVYDQPDYQPNGRTEIVNAKKFSAHDESTEVAGDNYWATMLFRAKIKQAWDISMYPFDTQELTIAIEDATDTTGTLLYQADTVGSRIAPDAIPDGWTLVDFKVDTSTTRYASTFGDPRLKADVEDDFNRVTATITLKREGTRLFITNFLGFLTATLLVIVVLGVNMSEKALAAIPLQPRVTLSVGALFSTVGSIYLLSTKLPYTTNFTLADSLQITTFVSITLAVISSVAVDILVKNGKQALIKKMMSLIFIFFLATHFGINGYLLTVATS